VAHSLSRMVVKAQDNNIVAGLIGHLSPNEFAILQYADDTVLCLQEDIEKLEMSNCCCTFMSRCQD
jgi:hypothetical protein